MRPKGVIRNVIDMRKKSLFVKGGDTYHQVREGMKRTYTATGSRAGAIANGKAKINRQIVYDHMKKSACQNTSSFKGP